MSSTTNEIAVILSGSGVYDGSEITETVSIMIHLSRHNASITFFAPDKPQMHVINHTTGTEMEGESRNCLVEASRITRGGDNIFALEKCKPENFDAVVIPGGFGVAKNLCDFAVKGADMTMDDNLEKILKEFRLLKKPIGLCCIAPILAAKVFPGVRVTVGLNEESEKFPYAGTASAVDKMGGCHVNTSAPCHEAIVDEDNLVVTSAAYMYAGKPHEIDDSVKAMVDGVMNLL